MIPPLELSIIVPAYNEETRLPRTLTRIREYFASRGMGSEQLEILIVDDGSEDGTVQVAEKWAVSYTHLDVYKRQIEHRA